MNVVVLTGSPHKKGTSSLLADRFADGCLEAGHTVTRFDCAFLGVHPCRACGTCAKKGECIFKDDFTKEIAPRLLEADVVCFASPTYWFNISAQLKLAVDRFFAFDARLHGKKSACLLVTCEGPDEVFRGIQGWYEGCLSYLDWQDKGRVLASRCPQRGDIEATDYPEAAWRLGKSL